MRVLRPWVGGGAAAIWENASRILWFFCVFAVNHALRPLCVRGIIPLQALSNGLEIELMTKLVPVFVAGMFLTPGLQSDRAQVRRHQHHPDHHRRAGTAPCMPAHLEGTGSLGLRGAVMKTLIAVVLTTLSIGGAAVALAD